MKRTPLKVLIDFMRSYSEHEALDEALDSIHEALADHLAAICFCADAAARSVANLDVQNDCPNCPRPAAPGHPALQPVLRRADVTTLLGYIATERDNATAESIRLAKRADVTVEHAIKVVQAMHRAEGLARAHELVTSMWEAAVITADAANADLTKEERPE